MNNSSALTNRWMYVLCGVVLVAFGMTLLVKTGTGQSASPARSTSFQLFGVPPADPPRPDGTPWIEEGSIARDSQAVVGAATFVMLPAKETGSTCIVVTAPGLGEGVKSMVECIRNNDLATNGWVHLLQIGDGPIKVWGVAPAGKADAITLNGRALAQRQGRFFFRDDVSVTTLKAVGDGAREVDVTFSGKDGVRSHKLRI